MKNDTTLTIAVVEESDQAHDAMAMFMRTKHKKGFNHVLFIYNIGPEELNEKDFPVAPHILRLVNNDKDLMTLKPYGKDYLTATADAMSVAQKQVAYGLTCELPKFYNFFSKPKTTLYNEYLTAIKSNDI